MVVFCAKGLSVTFVLYFIMLCVFCVEVCTKLSARARVDTNAYIL